jgi:DUF4097 and DUF4098 domain-containing protein YvlB
VRTNRQDLQHGRDDVGFETHFTLEVPPGTRVDVANEFGEVRVADVAFARIDNGHDSVRVERVAGELQVNARHGDVTIDGVGGTLSVKLRHGNLEVRDVTGHAALDLEHGDLKLARSGEAEVRLAHGSFDAEQVRGGLRFRGQHAGVVARGVEGAVDVETAYRDVELRDLGGDVRVVTQHGGIEIAGVRGGVQAQAQYDDVRLSGVSGPIEVAVEHGGVQLADIEQGARVKASGDDVVIEDFIGALQIDAQRGDVHLTPGGALRDALTVRTQHGGILLAVPSGSAFNLDAAAPTGEVDVRDLPGLELSLSTPEQVRGKVGGGGPAVTLEARRGDVRLESRQALADRD